MKLQIKNLDKVETLLILGTDKDKPVGSVLFDGEQLVIPKTFRYVLRPGEDREFYMNENQVLGIDQL